MRTKILLLTAAAVAAGLASSQAQDNVYSVNIVGYVNQQLPAGQFVLLATPLDAGTNDLDTLGAALPNKSSIQVWNGTGFTSASKIAGAWTTNLVIPPGTGFFVKSAANITNTFVGSVALSNSVAFPPGVFALVGSPIPFSGTLTDSGPNTLNLGDTLPNKSSIQVWNGNGFTSASKIAGAWTTNLTISVGQGFFVKSAGTTNWSQTIQ